MKKLLISLSIFGWLISPIVSANDNQFHILPEVEDQSTVVNMIDFVATGNDNINGFEQSSVMERYTAIANSEEYTLAEKMSSGILNRDTILEYIAYIIRFLSQVGLLIGAGMIIYAGYQYATTIFSGDWGKGSSAIKNAILGIIIITFSYAIMKLLTSLFMGS